MVIWLGQDANELHMVWLMPLPPASENPEWFILLVPAYPGSPGPEKRPLNDCVCVPVGSHLI